MQTPSPDFHARPSHIPWPPLIMGGAVLIGAALSWLVPIPLAPGLAQALRAIGVVMMGCAVSLDFWTFLTFRRHMTTVRPDRSASALATDGPFRYSRNPIYIGNTALIFGLGLAFGSIWVALTAPFVLVLIDRLAVRGEEKHLEARFGEPYRAYKTRVRRWL
ncbi:isoprenylcysteine carboxylmethyltransferase family protein [Afifella sp. IM 167]|uniref:methyltransferase family protein n=1 Tax=Afifella sp. IM 167 TaxID=2033586 RepID=UPI001CC9F1D6|nr:isoprenylcysteine carboxylmethyltransferase family protein [Afifella sp. IM 167]MBZ8132647.1 isoprenylcysteine carboxyl methyltransferase [Afifella sp. IM 167]